MLQFAEGERNLPYFFPPCNTLFCTQQRKPLMEFIRTIPEIWFVRTVLILCSLEIWLSGCALIRFGRRSRYFGINITLILLSAFIMGLAFHLYMKGAVI